MGHLGCRPSGMFLGVAVGHLGCRPSVMCLGVAVGHLGCRPSGMFLGVAVGHMGCKVGENNKCTKCQLFLPCVKIFISYMFKSYNAMDHSSGM